MNRFPRPVLILSKDAGIMKLYLNIKKESPL